jgi:fatty acid desaturase
MIHVASEEYLKTDRTDLYRELTELIKPHLCFEKQPGFYLKRLVWYVFVHIAMLYLVWLSSNVLWCILWITIDAIFILRLGFIGHDLAHGCVANTRFYKDLLGEFVWCFFLGLSKEFWDKKHNLHHKFTNIVATVDGDPDIETQPFILGQQQANPKSNLIAWVVAKYQHVFYWIALSLLVIGLSIESLIFILTGKFKNRLFEIQSQKWIVVTLILSGYVINNLPLLWGKPLLIGILLLIFKYLVAGFFIGLVFALNHVGLPTLSGDYPVDRLTLQTYTTRNISGAFGRWFWGVLAYQTEHHLWPAVSWHKLPVVAKITKDFCAKHQIIYNEDSPMTAFTDSAIALRKLGQYSVLTH